MSPKICLEQKRHSNVRALGHFIAGSLLLLSVAFFTIIYVYIVELKITFGYDQKEAEMLLAVYMFGKLFLLPLPAIYGRVGFYWSFTFGATLLAGGAAFMGFATATPTTFAGPAAIVVYISVFFIANGRAYMLILIIEKTMETIPKLHTGKAVGWITAMPGVGQIIFTYIFTRWFDNPEKIPFYFLIGAVSAVVATAFYLGVYAATGLCPVTVEETTLIPNNELSSGHNASSYVDDNDRPTDETTNLSSVNKSPEERTDISMDTKVSLKELMCSRNFQLYLWSGTTAIVSHYLLFVNLSLQLQSMRQEHIKRGVVTTMVVTIVLSRFISGVVYDRLDKNYKNIGLIFVVSVFNSMAYAVLVVWLDKDPAVFVAFILMAIALGSSWTTYIAFSAKLFGQATAHNAQSILLTSVAIFLTIAGFVTGLVSDKMAEEQHRSRDHAVICYGVDCYRWTYIGIFFISCISPVLLLVLLCRYKRILS